MKPMIAIVSLYDEKLESYWMLPGYAQGLEDAGAAPVILPLTTDEEALQRYADTFDGFLFPGGHDVDPALYGQTPDETCGTLCPQRDGMEAKFFPLALQTGKPMLGVCWEATCTKIFPLSAPVMWSTTRRRPTIRLPILWRSSRAHRCMRRWGSQRWG